MSARKLLTTLALTALAVPLAGADAKRKPKPQLEGHITGCLQKHRGSIDRIILRARARAVKTTASGATFHTITWDFKMTGPYVSKGEATTKSNAKGITRAALAITGPGEYLVDWTATRVGAKPDSGQTKITITEPVTAACKYEEIALT
jgi:hypothetical protein